MERADYAARHPAEPLPGEHAEDQETASVPVMQRRAAAEQAMPTLVSSRESATKAPSTAGAAHPLMRLPAQIGNRAVGTMVDGRVASRRIQRTVDTDSADPSVFNVDAIAYRLTHAIDFGAPHPDAGGGEPNRVPELLVMAQGGPTS